MYESTPSTDWHHGGLEPTSLHDQRLDAVVAAVDRPDTRRVLDIGCGSGLVIDRLLRLPQIERILGLDTSATALAQARERFGYDHPRVELRLAGFDEPAGSSEAFDAITLVEVIEHLPPSTLSRLEEMLFARLRPSVIVLTTPNVEWNGLLGLSPGQLRHPDHRFEWSRARFRAWARTLATRRGYGVQCADIGDWHPDCGAPSQLARFQRADQSGPAG